MAEDLSVLSRKAGAADLTLLYGSAADQVADLRYGRLADGGRQRPLLVFVHGGFWKPEYDRQHAEALSCALADAGWTVLTLEYRRVPGKPDLTMADLQTALSILPGQISQHNGQLILCGHSAGGHLVLWAAAAHISAQAVLALAPAADLELAHQLNLGEAAVQRFLGCAPEQRPEYNPMHLAAPQSRVVIVQGLDDDIVPAAVAISYCAKFPATRLVQIKDCGHFAVIDPASAAWQTVVRELQRLSPASA